MDRNVPIPAFVFLGCVAGFLVLVLIFYCYLNKLLCFKTWGGFPCIDKPLPKDEKTKKLGAAYGFDHDSSDSSDDEENEKHFAIGIQRSASMRSQREFKKAVRDDEEKGATLYERPSSEEPTGSYSRPLVDMELGAEAADYGTISSGSPPGSGSHENGGYSRSPEEFKITDDILSEEDHELISKCGRLEISIQYNPAKGHMIIGVIQCQDIPTKERGGANNTQIRLALFPTKKQRFKTKVKSGENPNYSEIFTFTKISSGEVNDMGVRFRLFGMERMRRERMIGEQVVGFAKFDLQHGAINKWIALEPRSNLSGSDASLDVSSLARSDSASSTQSMQHGGIPELLTGLCYNGTTGRLSVEILKGSNFKNVSMQRSPDTYVKLCLMSASGQQVAQSKTSVRRGQPNPLFKETFMFQVALFQLLEVTLMVSVYNKRSMKKKEMIGWFALGKNSSGEEEESHWTDMSQNKGEQVCRWHILLEA